MSSNQNTVYYCSVSKGGQMLYSHSVGDQEIEHLAALCLNKTPPYHKCYFQTMGKKTFGFLIEDGAVYFAIADKGLRSFGVLQFLKHVRDEYKKLSSKKGFRKRITNMRSLSIQEQLAPIIHHLITSLEHFSQNNNLPPEASSGLSPSPSIEFNGEIVASTRALLLSKSSKKEKKKKKKNKDHVIGMGEIETEELRSSTDRGRKRENDSSTSSVNKDVGFVRTRSINGTNNQRMKWCRLVRIVIVIDITVCLVLLGVWLVICGGVKCLS